jgi:uncharacterized protein YkwD
MKACASNLLAFVVAGICLVTVSAPAQDYDQAAEQQLFQLVNQERAKTGAPALKWDERLQQAAREHSALMAQKQQLSHQFPGEPTMHNRLAATGIRLDNDAENVAMDSEAAQIAHEGLMGSPPHRANILNPQYNAAGIGVVRQGGARWITEDFAHEVPERSDVEAEDMVAAAWQRERSRAQLLPARRVSTPRLRRMACEMARKGRLDTSMPLALAEVRSDVAYTQSQPERLPSSALKAAHDPRFTRFAVGACFVRDHSYPAGIFWVVIAFYI